MSTARTDYRYLTAVRIAIVAGAFSAVVAALLFYDFLQRGAKYPSDEIAYQAMLVAVRENPENEQFALYLSELDLRLRNEYFRRLSFTLIGAAMLAVGLGALALSLKAAASLRRELPAPGSMPPPRDVDTPRAQSARWAVAGLLGAAIASGAVAIAAWPTRLPRSESELAALLANTPDEDAPSSVVAPPAPVAPPPAASNNVIRVEPPHPSPHPNPTHPAPTNPAPTNPEPSAADTQPPPSEDELRKAWPRFRGYDGSGISPYDNVPTAWDGESGENIKWKVEVPLPGNNSPVVWGNRLFLTGADETQREVYCFSTDTGELLWRQAVPGTPESTAKPPKVMDDTGYAAPTAATDGRRVYAIFANGDMAAYTLEGKLAWSKSFGIPENSYGHAASLCTFENLVFVQIDQARAADGKSRLYAIDGATGNVAWEVKREVPNSWTSPIVVHAAERQQLITAADPWAISYNPRDGAELWRAKVLRMDVGPSPVYADGVVYVANEHPAMTAIRADGQGDLTADKDTSAKYLLWKGEDLLPDTASPLATAEYVFVVTSGAMLACHDAKSGDLRWEKEFDLGFSSSPSMIGGNVLVIDTEGNSWLIDPTGDEGKTVAEGKLGEECVTSPAFQDGRLYLRGKQHLFCIGK
jgi:outer membrane protein assembly factor BamB